MKRQRNEVAKPPYRIPSMREIRRVPLSRYKVASTFSGCGGSCLGFRWAGFKHVYASEFVPAARETYEANFPGVFVDARDIRHVKPEDILKRAKLRVEQLDVLEGSPPCASFSTAGKRAGGWGKVKKYSDVEQRTDDLFFEFVRLLRGLKPKTFVAENVAGLVKGVAKGYFLEIIGALRAEGYKVACRILDAQWLGVPQQRARTIFVGVREDLGVEPAHPTPLAYRYSIRDALPWVGGFEHDTSGAFSKGKVDVDTEPVPAITVGVNALNSVHYKVTDAVGFDRGTEERRRRRGARGKLRSDRPALAIMADGIGGAAAHQAEVRAPAPPESIERFAIGGEWKKLRPGQQSERYFNLVRPDAEEPVPTITQTGGVLGAASVTHPFEPRKFTIGELRRLGGFPDDFVLTGTYRQQWERIGRAVPPPMMYAVARTLRTEVLDKIGRR